MKRDTHGRKILLAAVMIAAAVFLLRCGPKPSAENAVPVTPAELPEAMAPGDVITFGRYEQDGNPENGPEPVEWEVLAAEGGHTLLISRYALDAHPFHDQWLRVTWENSGMRKWLNGTFYQTAFDPAEQARILTVTNTNPDNPTTGMPGGKDTRDRVFLLSIDEAERFFPSDESRQCRATAYAKTQAVYENEYKDSSWWWLRTRGSTSKNGALVLFSGYISTVGFGVNNRGGFIRPVIAVNQSEIRNKK